jgi:predicted O-methyltransferase YrrM
MAYLANNKLKQWNASLPSFSLDIDTIDQIFQFAKPLGHHEKRANANLGFGFLYYGLMRAVRPDHVLVIGSGFGFSVVCLALGLKDNGKGVLTFVDPSYNVLKHGPFKTVGGRGQWNHPECVDQHFGRFHVNDIVTHYRLTSDAFFTRFSRLGLPTIDVAFVDGNHSYENVRFDFIETLKRAKKNAYILLHDTNIYLREIVRNAGVKRWFNLIRREKACFEVVDFPFSSGVAIVRVLQDDAWRMLNHSL